MTEEKSQESTRFGCRHKRGGFIVFSACSDSLLAYCCLDQVYALTDLKDVYFQMCATSSSWGSKLWPAVLYGPKVILLLGCVFLALETRNVPSKFNESNLTGAVVYNSALCSLVSFATTYLLESSDPNASFLIENAALVYAMLFAISVYRLSC